MYEQLKKTRRQRQYLKYKLRNPSHKGRTGHNWKADKKDGKKTEYCADCGKIRLCEWKVWL